jgi:hypothetical protein
MKLSIGFARSYLIALYSNSNMRRGINLPTVAGDPILLDSMSGSQKSGTLLGHLFCVRFREYRGSMNESSFVKLSCGSGRFVSRRLSPEPLFVDSLIRDLSFGFLSRPQ